MSQESNSIMNLSDVSNKELLNQLFSFSKKISILRDTPFCTIRQQEELMTKVEFNRIMFKTIFDELSTRQLTEEEATSLSTAMQGQA